MTISARVAAVWRIEAARVIGGLARVTGDLALAEDLAQDALVAALEQWPRDGVPDNPAGWLTAVARRRWVDSVRRAVSYEQKLVEIGRGMDQTEDPIADLDDTGIADDKLGLIFAACHPVLAAEAQVALTLRMVGGLTTDEVASAFRVPVPTMAARITRAKKALGAAGVPFAVPSGDELAPRLAAVLDVVYLIFNEGYAASSGTAWTRPVLCDEAMRLARMLAAVAPAESETQSEAHGLVALLELQASRLRARTGPDGGPVQLLDQDRGRWDRTLITHALAALDRATGRGPLVLQAEIAACHARAGRAADTDWTRIAALYEELVELTGSPVVELNRAVAVAMTGDPAEALAIVDDLIAADLDALRSYHLVPAVRGDVLARLDRLAEASAEFRRAAELCDNAAERTVLLARAEDLPAAR